jgi:signal transduction histidine kinase
MEADAQVVTVETPPHAWVNADAPQLARAITNVVRNAVAYAPETTSVQVTVEETDDNARVRVRDQGPGIAASERHLIFDPFARGKVSDGREGRGLGLFIARRIVEAHGGAIGLRSVVPGAEFWIELPSFFERRSASAS